MLSWFLNLSNSVVEVNKMDVVEVIVIVSEVDVREILVVDVLVGEIVLGEMTDGFVKMSYITEERTAVGTG